MRKEVLVSHTLLLLVPHMYFCKQSKVCVFLKEKKQQLALAYQPTRLVFFCAENLARYFFILSVNRKLLQITILFNDLF